MNRRTGTLVEIFVEEASTMGKIRNDDGTTAIVSLVLIMNARVGDRLLSEGAIALSRRGSSTLEEHLNVFGDTGQSRSH